MRFTRNPAVSAMYYSSEIFEVLACNSGGVADSPAVQMSHFQEEFVGVSGSTITLSVCHKPVLWRRVVVNVV